MPSTYDNIKQSIDKFIDENIAPPTKDDEGEYYFGVKYDYKSREITIYDSLFGNIAIFNSEPNVKVLFNVNGLATKEEVRECFYENILNEELKYTRVREDILDELYKAIEEYIIQIDTLPPDEWRFGNVIELYEDLKAGKSYSERRSI